MILLNFILGSIGICFQSFRKVLLLYIMYPEYSEGKEMWV